MPKKLDHYDKKILELLQENAFISMKDLMEKVNLTDSPIRTRIKNLEVDHILGYQAVLNPARLNKLLLAYVGMKLENSHADVLEVFKKEIKSMPNIISCDATTGTHDLMLKIGVADLAEYQKFITEDLRRWKYIQVVTSWVVIEEIKNGNQIDLRGL